MKIIKKMLIEKSSCQRKSKVAVPISEQEVRGTEEKPQRIRRFFFEGVGRGGTKPLKLPVKMAIS